MISSDVFKLFLFILILFLPSFVLASFVLFTVFLVLWFRHKKLSQVDPGVTEKKSFGVLAIVFGSVFVTLLAVFIVYTYYNGLPLSSM